MRKVVIALAGGLVMVALSVNVAIGAAPRAHASAPPTCGTLYTPPCPPPPGPSATVASIASCQQTGKTITMPITLNAPAGLRKVVVLLGNKTIKSVKYKGKPKHATLKLRLNTRGFRPGIYTVTVKVTDARGRTVTRRAHFSICKPKPVFTG